MRCTLRRYSEIGNSVKPTQLPEDHEQRENLSSDKDIYIYINILMGIYIPISVCNKKAQGSRVLNTIIGRAKYILIIYIYIYIYIYAK